MTRLASVVVLAALVAAPGCTLYFDDGDDDDGDDGRPGDDGDGDDGDRPDQPPPNPDADDPDSALLIIGTAPSIERSDAGAAAVWLNYPALDCNPVNLYGVTVRVQTDEAFQRFVAAAGIEVGEPGGLVGGWLTLRRRNTTDLWRVTGWVAEEGGTAPRCYRW